MLTLRLLGPPEILIDGAPAKVTRRKSRALLYYLGMHDKPLRRERLYIKFQSKSIEIKNRDQALITGDLTIRDITREVVLDTHYAGMAKSPYGSTNAGFSASTRINRKDWGLSWNVALETGGVLVGEEIKIDIEMEIIQQPEDELETALA
jgi:hypothetical protein